VPDFKEYYWTCHLQRNIGTSTSDMNVFILARFSEAREIGRSVNECRKQKEYLLK
jgi:hypothetical protein